MFRRKKKEEPKVSVLRIPKLEWTQDDMAVASRFVKCPTFKTILAYCHEQLIARILHYGANDDYRSGFMDALELVQSFNKEPTDLKDSFETTSMQIMEDE